MNKISVVQAKAHFSDILMKVEMGHDVLITRRGTPVARLTGIERPKHPLNLATIDAFREGLAPARERSVDLIRRMRDESY